MKGGNMASKSSTDKAGQHAVAATDQHIVYPNRVVTVRISVPQNLVLYKLMTALTKRLPLRARNQGGHQATRHLPHCRNGSRH